MKKLLLIIIDQKASEMGKTKLVFKTALRSLSLMLLFILFSASLYSQNIRELESFLEQAKVSADPVLVSNAIHIESLIKDLQPTVYISNASIESISKQPICAEVDAGSTNQLLIENTLFNQVEIIIVKLNTPEDLNFIIDLSRLSGFTNLKDVLFLCEFECAAITIQRLFLPKVGINVFLKVSIPS